MERTFEEVLIEQCAPTFAGVKPANMFRFDPRGSKAEALPRVLEKLPFLTRMLESRGLGLYVLKRCMRTDSLLILVYRKKRLLELVSAPENRAFLAERGYHPGYGTEALLQEFSGRICLEQGFPHEIGLLLGYPLCDVRGFIENGGQGCTAQTLWKTYGDPESAKKSCAVYKKCTQVYTRLFRAGTPLVKLVVA